MFEKMNGETPDLTKDSIDKLKQLFPEIVTDGKIDFDRLQVILGKEIDDAPDRYNFTWHGKKETLQFAQQPSKGTLRPIKEKSKNWDTTGNLYIEGDNLEVLKLLQKSYNNKVKMIYIDPPYNTGNDFVYKDDFKDSVDSYLELTGQKDGEGKKFTTNTESSGRYHTDWLNMMYSRLKLARNLLKDDGVIFISIDDIEQKNLRAICDEIFGESNFVSQIVWKNKYGAGAKTVGFIDIHEYILCYGKKPLTNITSELSQDDEKRYSRKDNHFNIRGGYYTQPLATRSLGDRPNLVYPIKYKDQEIWPNKQWVWSKERMEEAINNDFVEFTEKDGKFTVRSKQYLYDENGQKRRGKPLSLLNGPFTQEATFCMREIFDDKNIFDFSKPEKLLRYLLKMQINDENDKDFIVLDFFSGSGTLAHSTIQLNAEDGGNRKFIMVQLPEILDEKSEAYKDGYRTICDIGEERIRRAGEKVKSDLIEKNNKEGLLSEDQVNPDDLDIGFKVFSLDNSNLMEWQANFDDLESNIDLFESNFLSDRSDLDILFEIMLKNGLDLTYPVTEISEGNYKIYDVAAGNLFVCLNDNINRDVARKIAALRIEYGIETSQVVFKDSGFEDDTEKLNCYEILKEAGYQDSDLLSI